MKQKGGIKMEKEKLTKELTEKVSGGKDIQSQFKGIRESIESRRINVKCAKCGKEFKYFDDGLMAMGIEGAELFKLDIKKRTCPKCGHVNSEKELGI